METGRRSCCSPMVGRVNPPEPAPSERRRRPPRLMAQKGQPALSMGKRLARCQPRRAVQDRLPPVGPPPLFTGLGCRPALHAPAAMDRPRSSSDPAGVPPVGLSAGSPTCLPGPSSCDRVPRYCRLSVSEYLAESARSYRVRLPRSQAADPVEPGKSRVADVDRLADDVICSDSGTEPVGMLVILAMTIIPPAADLLSAAWLPVRYPAKESRSSAGELPPRRLDRLRPQRHDGAGRPTSGVATSAPLFVYLAR